MGFIKITKVNFNPDPISPKTVTIRHRLTSAPDVSGSYTTDSIDVAVNIDGTFVETFWILNLLNETSYTVKIDTNCGEFSFQEEFVTTCNCPEGFEYDEDADRCKKEETIAPVITHSNYCLALSRNGAYGNRFARIYNYGFNNSSIAMIVAPTADVFAQMTLAPYWANPTLNPTLGVVNRHSVWIDSDCNGTKDSLAAGQKTTLAYSFVNNGAARRVHVLISADNQFELKHNGTTIAKTTVPNSQENFKIAHIFPVDIINGVNDFNAVATGDGTVNDAIAMLVFDNTAQEVKDATADNMLNILFKSSDLIGSHIDIATCAPEYSLDTSGGQGNYVCRKITYADCAGIPDENL